MGTILFIILSFTTSVETQIDSIFNANETSSSSTSNLTDGNGGHTKIGQGGGGTI